MDNTNKQIRIGIVGYGNIGARHAFFLMQNPAFILDAICDIKTEKENMVPDGVKFCSNIEQMLDDTQLDIVSICTPNGLHKTHAIMCMQKGKDVLVEKPLCISVSDCYEILDVEKKTGKKVYTIMQNRFNPAVQFAQKLVAENQLGEVLSIDVNCFWNRGENYYSQSDWHGDKQLDGGILYTQFSHFIDVLTLFTKEKIEVDFGILQNRMHQTCSQLEDQGSFILHAGKCLLSFNYSINATNRNMEGSVLLIGTKGTVKIGGQYINRIEYCELQSGNEEYRNKITTINGQPVNNNQYKGGYQGSMSNHDKVFDNLAKHVFNGNPYYTSVRDGIEVVRIIDHMYKIGKFV